MTRSDQLCQALNEAMGNTLRYDFEWEIIKDAARFALRVWEGDEQLVRRIAMAIWDKEYDYSGEPWSENIRFVEHARAVLAAITEQDQK